MSAVQPKQRTTTIALNGLYVPAGRCWLDAFDVYFSDSGSNLAMSRLWIKPGAVPVLSTTLFGPSVRGVTCFRLLRTNKNIIFFLGFLHCWVRIEGAVLKCIKLARSTLKLTTLK